MGMPKSNLPAAGVVARVSSVAQEEDGTSLDTQVEACVAQAIADGYSVAEEHIWRDVAPGKSSVRPGLGGAIEALENVEIEVVYIYDPDRLARDPLLMLNLCAQIQDSGGMVRFLHGPSVDTEEGKAMAYLLGFSASIEHRQIAERSMRGKRQVALMGRMPVGVGGGGMFGYDYCTILKIRTVNEAEAYWVVWMFERYAEGKTTYWIATELNRLGVRTKRGKQWYARTVGNILRHESYNGVDYYGRTRWRTVYENRGTVNERRRRVATPQPEEKWIRILGFSPIIVDHELWARVQERLAMPRARRTQKDVYVLTGFARCPRCDSPICGGSRYRGVRRYRCRGTNMQPAKCKAAYIEADLFEETVLEGVKSALRNPEVVLAELEEFLTSGDGEIGEQAAKLKRQVEECLKKERRLMALYGDGDIDQDMLKQEVAPCKALRMECQRALDRIERQRELHIDADRARELVTERCRELAEGLDDLDFEGVQALLDTLDVKVLAERGEVSISMTVSGKRTTIGRTSA